MSLNAAQIHEIHYLIERTWEDPVGADPPAPEKGKDTAMLRQAWLDQQQVDQQRFTMLQGIRADLRACLENDPEADPDWAIRRAREVLGVTSY